MKNKIISIILVLILSTLFTFNTTAISRNFEIINPYKDVVWEGEGKWGAYKGSLHTHSTYSDADVSLKQMVVEYYNQDFGFLGMADHGVTGIEWNMTPDRPALYLYQYLLGCPVEHLTDEEFSQISDGTYPKYDGSTRENGLVCVRGSNELNSITLCKGHVVGYNLPSNVGKGHAGVENGHREAVEFAEENGGFSVIAHPGDWLDSKHNISAVYDKENIDYFKYIFLDHKTCLGLEVFNEKNSVTPYDRILWDNLLMETLEYGRVIYGFSNSDAHTLDMVDSSFSVFMMSENTEENILETMHSGSFFAVTRRVKENDVIGPAKDINVIDERLSIPMATNIRVDGKKIILKAENADFVQWIANGEIIATTPIIDEGTSVLDLSEFEGAEDFLYVRAEIFGEGGCCASQPFVIDDSMVLEYEKDNSFLARLQYIWHRFKSIRLIVIFDELFKMI